MNITPGELRPTPRHVAFIALILIALSAPGCASQTDWRPPQRPLMPLVEEIRPPSTDMRFVQRCPSSDFQPARTGPWISAASERLAQNHTPTHIAPDQIITTGQPLTLHARLSYADQPLQGEWARIFWGSCERGWEQIGHLRTDADGRLAWPMTHRPSRGRYTYAVQVVGDQTFATGNIWIVAPEVRAVAISASAILHADTLQPASQPQAPPEAQSPPAVDAAASPATASPSTVTPTDETPPAPATTDAAPQPPPTLTPGARELAAYYARRGYLVIYLVEDSWQDTLTPTSLAALGLPAGPVITSEGQGALPDEPSTPGNRWEDASARATGGGPPLSIILTHHFVATSDAARLPPSLPLTPLEVVPRNDAPGWEAHLQTLTPDTGTDTQPSHQIIRPAHAVPNHPRSR
ncbi:hypothetical protein FRC98_03225 [Lujinxingia vulgaris]|uniref:Uncharacterized protein n=1 Tax=Lujinxingia vulgaris TaxID=2600176 RepID=A0A5C6XDH1_9DELT|nr:hypothetical protein [Lujinxingia vulgaris]TXD39421.1 hypothetical protein FRC98_03225 [Lujinxingia vulgaris]